MRLHHHLIIMMTVVLLTEIKMKIKASTALRVVKKEVVKTPVRLCCWALLMDHPQCTT